jgi:hypothetical protein
MGVKALGKTGEGYCEDWLKEQIYSRKKDFSSKYTEKGLIMEDEAIDMVANYLNLGLLFKNEQYFESEYMTGTPDVILPEYLIDIKCSWDCFTFPLFDVEVPANYYWQAQVYMALTNRKSYKLIYVLTDTPLNLIEKEAYWWCKSNGYEELDQDVYKRFVDKMTYPNIPMDKKIKVFEIQRNDSDIEKIIGRVKECREYIVKCVTEKTT